jgi:hypothetical protein
MLRPMLTFFKVLQFVGVEDRTTRQMIRITNVMKNIPFVDDLQVVQKLEYVQKLADQHRDILLGEEGIHLFQCVLVRLTNYNIR